MMAEVVIISIDESSFKQEGLPHRYWQANSKLIKQLFKSGTFDVNNSEPAGLIRRQLFGTDVGQAIDTP